MADSHAQPTFKAIADHGASVISIAREDDPKVRDAFQVDPFDGDSAGNDARAWFDEQVAWATGDVKDNPATWWGFVLVEDGAQPHSLTDVQVVIHDNREAAAQWVTDMKADPTTVVKKQRAQGQAAGGQTRKPKPKVRARKPSAAKDAVQADETPAPKPKAANARAANVKARLAAKAAEEPKVEEPAEPVDEKPTDDAVIEAQAQDEPSKAKAVKKPKRPASIHGVTPKVGDTIHVDKGDGKNGGEFDAEVTSIRGQYIFVCGRKIADATKCAHIEVVTPKAEAPVADVKSDDDKASDAA